MARQRHCKVCKEWHELDAWPNECFPERITARSNLSAPSVIGDTMTAVQSQLDGQMYESKSALRNTYKSAGVVEVGNDSSVMEPKRAPKAKPDRAGIRDSIDKSFSQAGFGV